MPATYRRWFPWKVCRDGSPARHVQAFLEAVQPPPYARIADLGGDEQTWASFDHQFEVTLVRSACEPLPTKSSGRFAVVMADFCNLREVFAPRQFDIVYSHSMIEHLGDEPRQARFAREVRRLAYGYWIHTPSDRSPLEAHTGLPFYWQLPELLREGLLVHGSGASAPAWLRTLAHTRPLSRERMVELFPHARIHIGHILGIETWYAAYRPFGL